MAFHNVELPSGFRYGSLVGPSFQTVIQETASGHEIRVSRRSQFPHRFRLLKELLSTSDATALKSFALGRRGALHSFLLTDWHDYTSNDDGKTAPTNLDQTLGTCDGSATCAFQLVKEYDSSGPDPYTRTITCPNVASVVVSLNGASTSSFSCSSDGVVTVTGTQPAGTVVQAGFTFRVPVRFEKSVDDWAKLSVDSYGVWSIPDLDCKEVLDEVQWPETWWSGGGTDHGQITTDQSISFRDGQLHAFDCRAVSISVFLPAVEECPGGNMVLTVHNKSTATSAFQLRDDTGTAVGGTIAAGQTVRLLLLVSGGTATWIVV